MKNFIILVVLILLSCSYREALADELLKEPGWNLPLTLSEKNVRVSFELDSTWHTVHGTALTVTGHVGLRNLGDPNSIEAHVSIPVDKLDTENSMRDKKMRKVMSADKYPNIIFKSSTPSFSCLPGAITKNGSCFETISGNLTIMKESKNVSIPIEIRADEQGGYVVRGKIMLSWAEYGVEDPSILVARVDPEVQVRFELHIPRESSRSSL